jgi:hypothetical protein
LTNSGRGAGLFNYCECIEANIELGGFGRTSSITRGFPDLEPLDDANHCRMLNVMANAGLVQSLRRSCPGNTLAFPEVEERCGVSTPVARINPEGTGQGELHRAQAGSIIPDAGLGNQGWKPTLFQSSAQ